MATESRQSLWTDERLDDLNQTVRDGFSRTDAEIRGLRREMNDGFARTDARIDGLDGRIDGLRGEMNDGFARSDARFDSFQRTMLLGMIGLVGTTVASALATIVTLA